MFVIWNTQNSTNRPRPITGAGSTRKGEIKNKGKGKGRFLPNRPEVSS